MGLVNNEREGWDGGEGEGRRRDGTDKTARKVREGRLSAAKMMLRTRNVEMNCSREKGGGERGALSASSGDEEGARTRTTKNWIPSSCSALWMWSSIVRGRSSAFSAVEPRTNSSKIICSKRKPTIQELARILAACFGDGDVPDMPTPRRESGRTSSGHTSLLESSTKWTLHT